ncbi:transcription factor IIA, alpha/beta subunit-domain-containing protein [Panaeolus papilionaceus]|nr:transcription factor IIA, alpha/beta subunit-domain-containing protein [Panaeolus papilionaceus]
MKAIKPEFDEFGVSEEVLADLQSKWEQKVIASNVAEFNTTQAAAAPAVPHAAVHQQHPYPPPHLNMMAHPHYPPPVNPYSQIAQPAAGGTAVKTEPIDNRYMLNHNGHYSLPPLPGPAITASRQLPPPKWPVWDNYNCATLCPPQPASSTIAAPRIPQVDGPSESSDEDSPSPPPSGQFAPRASHPSLPQPPVAQRPSVHDSEAINSDLDDSDTEGDNDSDEGAAGESDIVFCTYDKVARVKNKWKCILKDGMIHINGKDYLFAKCTGYVHRFLSTISISDSMFYLAVCYKNN